MNAVDTGAAMLLAFGAMYGLGIPLAWMLPAPREAQWLFRICISPLYAIVIATAAGWLCGALGIPLHPGLLVAIAVLAWLVAWGRARERLMSATTLQGALLPSFTVLLAFAGWGLSLVRYGLYLPNRDFKNHAYFVAQVAFTRSADPSLILRESSASPPQDVLFYPLGLHTLLGWALPHTTTNSVGVTAASVVLASSVSAPLALMVLARLWNPESALLAGVAGFAAVCLPSLTSPFAIGSAVLIVATVLYIAALAGLWSWSRTPSWGGAVAVVLTAWGLFAMHVAEAVALIAIGLACLPAVMRRTGVAISRLHVVVLVVSLAVAAYVSWDTLQRLSGRLDAQWDLQANTESPVYGAAATLLSSTGASALWSIVWLSLAGVGLWIARDRGMSYFPLLAISVPLVFGSLAAWSGTPPLVNLLTAPWYGATSRVSLLVGGPLVLAGCLALTTITQATRSSRSRVLASGLTVVTIAGLTVDVVPTRRQALAGSLAGAGDSLSVARDIAEELQPGETVVNLEADGTANLFAYARVPVLEAFAFDETAGRPLEDPQARLSDQLMRLSDPEVARRFADLNVAYIALGTTSRYWGSAPGYVWQAIASQSEVELHRVGTDLVVLRYLGDRA